MSACGSNVTPFLAPEKACSGKCLGDTCRSGAPRVWVVAACNGMVSLFERTGDHLKAVSHAGSTAAFPSLEAFTCFIRDAVEHDAVDQLMVVGSDSDVAWIERALPEAAARRLVAEMKYPLLPGWFNQGSQLTSALERILQP